MITPQHVTHVTDEYATLSGMTTDDLLILQHHVTPKRYSVIRRILDERGA